MMIRGVRSHTHKPPDHQVIPGPGCGPQRKHLIHPKAMFGFLHGDMYLQQDLLYPSVLGCPTVQFVQELQAIHSMHQMHEWGDVLHLVGLEVADEMPFNVGRK